MPACRVCHRVGSHREWIAREMMYGLRTQFRYFGCSACGCVQIEAIPPDLAVYYPGEYYSPLPCSWGKRLKDGVRRPFRSVRFRSLLRRGGSLAAASPGLDVPAHLVSLMRRFGIALDSPVLDVGCGPGKFLRYLSTVGFRNLAGIDPFLAEDVTLPGGIRLMRREIGEVDGAYDLILANHSLEHMPDQGAAISAISRLLSPSGVAVVRIPTVSSYAWEHYGVDWVQFDAPRHLYLHSRESFRILVERHGLQLVDIRDDSTEFQFWGSEQYRRGIPLRSPESFLVHRGSSLFSREEMETFRRRAEELNREGRGDQFSAALSRHGTEGVVSGPGNPGDGSP